MSTSIVQKVPEASQLPQEIVDDLQKNFNPLFDKAQEWKNKAESLTVTDESETEKMEEAKKARLELKKIRTNADKIRKDLKQESLLKGKAIDGMFNIIKYLVVPLEEHLEKQEKFVEIKEKERLDALEEKRREELLNYMEDTSAYHLREMSEETYQDILQQQKELYHKRQREIKEQQEREYKEGVISDLEHKILRWGIENITLDKDSLLGLSIDDFETKVEEINVEVANSIEKIKAENEKLKKEKEELERQKREQEEQERKRQEEERKRQKEEQEAQRQAQLAPDKDKLKMLANSFSQVEYPSVQSDAAQKVIAEVQNLANKINKHILESLENL